MAALEKDSESAEGIPVAASPYVADAPRYVVPPATAYLQDKREARRRRLSDPELAIYEQRPPDFGERLAREAGVYGANQVRFQDDERARETGTDGRNSRRAQTEDPLAEFRRIDGVYIGRKEVGSIYEKFVEEFEPTHDIWSPEYFQELGKFVLDTGSLPKIKLSRDSDLPRAHGRVHSLYEDVEGSSLTKQDFLSDYGFSLASRKWSSLNRAMLKAQIQIEFAGMAEREHTSGPQWFRLLKLFKYWDDQSEAYIERERGEERKLAESWYERKLEEWGTHDEDAASRYQRGKENDEQRPQPGVLVINNRRNDRSSRRGELRRHRRGSDSSNSNDSDDDSGSGYSRDTDSQGKKPWGRRIASWFSIREIVDRRIAHRKNFSHGPARREAKEERHLRHAVRTAELPQRIVAAVLGGALLITPMLIMSIHQTKTKSLITACISVYTFGLGLAFFSSVKIAELLGALAAYAAVLVVFVGVSGP